MAKLLNKLLIEEQTKSRSRHSNDNAQAESKNGAIVRKHLRLQPYPTTLCSLVNRFCCDQINPYLNFHRPCLFAETLTDTKGRQRKRYPLELMMTPHEKLKSIDDAEQLLKPGITFEQLDAQATAMSDNDAERRTRNSLQNHFQPVENSRLTKLTNRPAQTHTSIGMYSVIAAP